MAAPTKKFVVRSAEAIVLAEDEQQKRRQERLRSHFTDSGPASALLMPTSCSLNNGGSSQQLQQLVVPPQATRASALVENLTKIRDTARHAEVVKELLSLPVDPPAANSSLKPSGSNALLISNRQKGNPIVKCLCNVRLEYVESIPDFVMGRTMCSIFLSTRYHALYPDYIHERLKLLGKAYELRVLLVLVDSKDPHHSLKDLTKISILADCTLVLAWSYEEAAKHLETYKMFENKPPEILMKKQESDSYSKVIDALSSVRTINKSDATSLMATFGTFENIAKASKEDLEVSPGMGPKKARDLHSVLHKPFLKFK